MTDQVGELLAEFRTVQYTSALLLLFQKYRNTLGANPERCLVNRFVRFTENIQLERTIRSRIKHRQCVICHETSVCNLTLQHIYMLLLKSGSPLMKRALQNKFARDTSKQTNTNINVELYLAGTSQHIRCVIKHRSFKRCNLPICPINSILIPWCSSLLPGFFRVTLTFPETVSPS